jgi:Rrf2 family protein
VKLNKRTQYAFLFTLYLCRSGRATVDSIANQLGLSHLFLSSIANQLKKEGVVASFKGPNGGYELYDNITVGDVYTAVNETAVMPLEEIDKLSHGDPDHRSFAQMVRNLKGALQPVMRRQLRNVSLELAANEFGAIKRLDETSSQH